MMTPLLKKLLTDQKADPELTQELLDRVNRGDFATAKVVPAGFPGPDGKQILDLRDLHPSLSLNTVLEGFQRYFPQEEPGSYGDVQGSLWIPRPESLRELGLKLLSRTAYGVLNGGSATSYGDEKKNKAYGEALFSLYESQLRAQAQQYEGQPKGITPAFIHPDGTSGPSFMELKLRALLIQSLHYQWSTGKPGVPAVFQMTSHTTDGPIAQRLKDYTRSPYLAPLLEPAGWKQLLVDTGIQGLIGTYTPQDPQGQRQVFTYEKDGEIKALPLPGGHGQNFRVLRHIYQDLFQRGYRFLYIGNVDNLGYLPDPVSVALLAFTRAPAGFDFSFKTPVDVKGGVLYRRQDGRLDCGDIGVAISSEEVKNAERQGAANLLFNCASGLFDLEALLTQLDRIIQDLPLRLSEQDKDVGRYAQVEQVTWEVLGLLENPLIFAVEKQRRFLAAKLLIESYMTSGYLLDHYQGEDLSSLKVLAQGLNAGLKNLLEGPYGLVLRGSRWEPLSLEELQARYKRLGNSPLRA